MIRHNQFRFDQRRGFAIAPVIFILVILAGLSAGILSLANTQHSTQAQDLMGSRAYHAARSGIEYAAYQITQGAIPCSGGSCTLSPLPVLDSPLDGFTVQFACSCYGPYDEAGVTREIFRLDATASAGTMGSISRIERSISITLAR